MAEYTDLGLSKNPVKIKKSMQIEKKNKEVVEMKDGFLGNSHRVGGGGAENMLGFGRSKGYSRKELSKKFTKKKN